jgi:hypothetical protein
MGWLNLGEDRGVRVRAGCIKFRIGVCGYRLPVSRSRYYCECMDRLYLGQYMGVSVWAGCIKVRIGEYGYGRLNLGQDRGVKVRAGCI